MRSPRLVVVALLAVIVLCGSLIHSSASGQGSAAPASGPAATAAAGRPSPADLATALKAAAILNRCGSCHRADKTVVHGWTVGGKEVLWGQDMTRLVAEGRFVPGNLEESKLYQFYVSHVSESLTVSSGHKTAPGEVKLLGQWIAGGCIDPKIKSASRPALSEAANARKAVAVLDRCCQCHRHGWQEEGKPKVTWGKNIARLIEEKQVVPGKPDESRLLTIAHDSEHPKYDATPEAMADDVKTLEQWISQGCLDPSAKSSASKASSRQAGGE